jgi:hypothetical protein
MLSLVIQTTIISIIFIFLVHHLFNFFKTTLTVPKIKDLVNSPTKKYEEIYNTISNNNDTLNDNNKLNYNISDLLPTEDTKTMKTELKNFLKKQLNSNNPNTIADFSWSSGKKIFSSSDIDNEKGFAPY